MAEKSVQKRVTIAGQAFLLRRADVVRALRGVDPEPIASHYVVIGSHRYPPKQAISVATGLDRADFTTHQARRTLMRLGFPAGRRRAPDSKEAAGADGDREAPYEGLADRLRPLAGQWVALRDEDVLHASSSPQALVAWLSRHGQRADSVFRVPDTEVETTGIAPL